MLEKVNTDTARRRIFLDLIFAFLACISSRQHTNYEVDCLTFLRRMLSISTPRSSFNTGCTSNLHSRGHVNACHPKLANPSIRFESTGIGTSHQYFGSNWETGQQALLSTIELTHASMTQPTRQSDINLPNLFYQLP